MINIMQCILLGDQKLGMLDNYTSEENDLITEEEAILVATPVPPPQHQAEVCLRLVSSTGISWAASSQNPRGQIP